MFGLLLCVNDLLNPMFVKYVTLAGNFTTYINLNQSLASTVTHLSLPFLNLQRAPYP